LARRPDSSRGRPTSQPASQMMLARQVHAYLSVFVAPTILFFAFTGALQLFGLHEAHGDYRPPALIEKLGMLHREQKFALKPKPQRLLPSPAATAKTEGDWVAPAAGPASDMDDDAPTPREQALKWLFFGAAVTLMISALLGLWVGLTQNRRKGLLAVILLAGMAAPVAIVMLL